MREEEFLKERAKKFLREAKDDMKKNFFDLAAFHLEQALQLRIKHFLVKKIGYFSKTHSLSELLSEAERVWKKIREITIKNKESIEELELAYIGSRYLPIVYSERKVRRLLKFVEKFFRVLEKYES